MINFHNFLLCILLVLIALFLCQLASKNNEGYCGLKCGKKFATVPWGMTYDGRYVPLA